MAFGSNARSKLDDAQAQIEGLREQVNSLMNDRVTPVVADFAGRTQTAVQDATAAVRQQADVVSGQVKQQPLIAIMVAVGVGWLIGRITR
jgi:ElaB/YqjD/DUF883 family membrane-anchored ribosome-binding protein